MTSRLPVTDLKKKERAQSFADWKCSASQSCARAAETCVVNQTHLVASVESQIPIMATSWLSPAVHVMTYIQPIDLFPPDQYGGPRGPSPHFAINLWAGLVVVVVIVNNSFVPFTFGGWEDCVVWRSNLPLFNENWRANPRPAVCRKPGCGWDRSDRTKTDRCHSITDDYTAYIRGKRILDASYKTQCFNERRASARAHPNGLPRLIGGLTWPSHHHHPVEFNIGWLLHRCNWTN